MRKLASIQTITSVEPIADADRIELVHVLGWQCVAPKGQLKPGDPCVYFEIDSYLPLKETFAFLDNCKRHNELLGEGYLIRTKRFRGQISQGLVMPLDSFDWTDGISLETGTDVSEYLGVREWQIPEAATSGGTVIGNLPGLVHKTDETRIQSCPELLEEFRGIPYYITTKLDGSSHTISLDDNGFHVCGHNYEYKDDGTSSFYEYAKKRGFEEKLQNVSALYGNVPVTVQGEWCGSGIQNNHLKLQNPEWFVFTVDINGKRVGWNEIARVAEAIGAKTVPLEETGNDLPAEYPDENALLERCMKDPTKIYKGAQPEGIVIRPMEPVYSKAICGMLSMKILNNRYLLKNQD